MTSEQEPKSPDSAPDTLAETRKLAEEASEMAKRNPTPEFQILAKAFELFLRQEEQEAATQTPPQPK